MAIKRYFADADNTITNAFQENLTTRGTGSNSGRSDILEVFSIYAQESATSTELSRILLQFPVSDIATDRTAGNIPASGSVSFYLKMFNAKHPHTLPSDYKLTIQAISGSWQEGNGLDMEGYSDVTYDNIGSNWINANNNFVSASATVTALSKTAGEANTRVLTVADSSGNSVNFQIDNSLSTSTATKIAFSNANSNANQFATNIAAAVNAANTATTLNVVASAESATVTLTQTAAGAAGNSAADISGTAVSDSVVTIVKQFGGGNGKWATAGGDYFTDTSSSFDASFPVGNENLEVDVTTLVEQWVNSDGNVLGSKENNGFGIRLSSSYEAYDAATNPDGAVKSYYTKKFFARDSEFFFDRPVLEARWNSTKRDNRGNFVISSSAAPAEDNLNKLYLYNYVRGRLVDVAGDASVQPVFKLYYSSGSVPEGSPRGFLRASNNSAITSISATRESKGVYFVNIAATSSIVNSTYPYLVDVWSISGGEEFCTGSAFEPIRHGFVNHNPNQKYVVNVTNLKKKYLKGQTERFRLYVREKNWSPNIYTVAKSTPENLMIQSASYQIVRSVDQRVVIPYGTGSDNATMLSYDVSGNYFDLDMGMLESGYTYDLKLSFYEDSVSSYREQPYVFKIRVEQDEY